ncbi:uncharacterized protein LOC124180219 isoform X1 [Neodiprion fabricii]|uniref:uncharacterized protein LOC124180219 isoform X1 n=1 Tax=Neodiprion fabricii TaxID=2872261 RepID=UPI001ED926D1|nr:uncharacterized protein LOC124180219 isoform X1 [Neodiprion fabricii]
MGLLMSVLIGCVGVLELLACLRHVSDGLTPSLGPAAPCLSYHSETSERHSSVNSLCTYSHRRGVGLPRGVRHKLENLHEYSIKVKGELRTLDRHFDESTLSDCSTGDILGNSRPDSRLSLNEYEAKDEWNPDFQPYYGNQNAEHGCRERHQDGISCREDQEINSILENLNLIPTPTTKKYERIPTPIPFENSTEDAWRKSRSPSSSSTSSERKNSFDDDSGNEVPTRNSIDNSSVASQSGRSSLGDIKVTRSSASLQKSVNDVESISKHSSDVVRALESSTSVNDTENLSKSSEIWKEHVDGNGKLKEVSDYQEVAGGGLNVPKSSKSLGTTIVRKATRLKSKNAEISKSAETLNAKKFKKVREPERRKSDISVQTTDFDSKCDEATNTSRSESRQSVSVQVQTSFEEYISEDENAEDYSGIATGLSESRRDISAMGNWRKKSFKQRRFNGSVRNSKEDCANIVVTKTLAPSVEKPRNLKQPIRVSSFEDANVDDYEKVKSLLLETDRSESRSQDEDSRKNSGSSSTHRNDAKRPSTFKTQSEMLDELIDEEFKDAEDGSNFPDPIEYSVPDTGSDKAFWLIFSGEFTRAMNKDWHSGHFCCWQCDESLTGQRYVLRDEHPYCIKCYESVFANGCEECSKIIGIDSKDLSYKDKHWHEACFLCNKCRVSLVDKQFGSKVDKIYCGNCYDAQFASRCDGCGEIFRAGTKKMEYKTRQWHEKCFCCVVCKNPIGTKSFIPREQEIYCAGCYEDKFATRCVKCNKIITSGGVTYKNEPWHRECFTCSNCSTSLAGQRFTSRDEKPYCADCFGEIFAKRCTACTKPITGIGGTRFISFEDRHWHNDCFICAGCKTSLVGRGFITDADDIICPECAKQKLM